MLKLLLVLSPTNARRPRSAAVLVSMSRISNGGVNVRGSPQELGNDHGLGGTTVALPVRKSKPTNRRKANTPFSVPRRLVADAAITTAPLSGAARARER